MKKLVAIIMALTMLISCIPMMAFADEAEPLIPEGYLPYPTYEQILFYV